MKGCSTCGCSVIPNGGISEYCWDCWECTYKQASISKLWFPKGCFKPSSDKEVMKDSPIKDCEVCIHRDRMVTCVRCMQDTYVIYDRNNAPLGMRGARFKVVGVFIPREEKTL